MGEKSLKSSKSEHMQPLLWVCKGLLVIIREGCRWFGDNKLLILDLES